MSGCFSHCDTIDCPNCPPFGKQNRRHQLVCVESNYSGCGVDIGACPECGRAYEISYQVAEVVHIPRLDGETRVQEEERLANERKLEQEEADRKDRDEYERLKLKFESK